MYIAYHFSDEKNDYKRSLSIITQLYNSHSLSYSQKSFLITQPGSIESNTDKL